MSTKNNNDQNVTKSIKETAGAAFHSVHNALEATENAAMNAVDATANTISKLANKTKNNNI